MTTDLSTFRWMNTGVWSFLDYVNDICLVALFALPQILKPKFAPIIVTYIILYIMVWALKFQYLALRRTGDASHTNIEGFVLFPSSRILSGTAGRTWEPVCKAGTTKAERFAVETHHFRIQHHTHITAARVRHAHITRPQGATTKRQPWIGASRSAGVGGSGLAIALGSGWPAGIKTQTKGQNQPTGYYH